MKKVDWTKLLGFAVIPEIIGILASFLSGNISSDYQLIVKPPFSPPSWLFGFVWPILYMLMGIAAYLVSQSNEPGKKTALKFYWLQLFLNFLWPIVFFGFNQYWLAAIILAVMIILIIITMVMFKSLNKAAFYLMIPYLLWSIFALYLNIGIAALN